MWLIYLDVLVQNICLILLLGCVYLKIEQKSLNHFNYLSISFVTLYDQMCTYYMQFLQFPKFKMSDLDRRFLNVGRLEAIHASAIH